MFLKILQNAQENTCVGVSFLIVAGPSPDTLLKKKLLRRRFPVYFATFLRIHFTIEQPSDCFSTEHLVSKNPYSSNMQWQLLCRFCIKFDKLR